MASVDITKKKKKNNVKKNQVMIDKLCQAIVANVTNGMSGNATMAGDPTAANRKPQTASAGAGAIITTTTAKTTTMSLWLHLLWVHLSSMELQSSQQCYLCY